MPITIKNVLASYAHLDAPWTNDAATQAAKYRSSFLFPFTDEATMNLVKGAIVDLYKAELAGKNKNHFPKIKGEVNFESVMKILDNNVTFYDGSSNLHETYHKGEPDPAELANYAELRASSQADRAPKIFDRFSRQLNSDEIREKVFAGQIVHAVVNPYSYERPEVICDALPK